MQVAFVGKWGGEPKFISMTGSSVDFLLQGCHALDLPPHPVTVV